MKTSLLIFGFPLLAVACVVALSDDEQTLAPSTRDQMTYDSPVLEVVSSASSLELEIAYSGRVATLLVDEPVGAVELIASRDGQVEIRSLVLELGELSHGDKGLPPGGFFLRNARLVTIEPHWCQRIDWLGDHACEADFALDVAFDAEMRMSDDVWLPVHFPAAASLSLFAYSEDERLTAMMYGNGESTLAGTFPIAVGGLALDLVASEPAPASPGHDTAQ